MVRRALLLALFSVAMLAAPAAAQQGPPGGAPYPDDRATITPAGEVLRILADGFLPGRRVGYQVDYTPFSDENAMGVVGGYEGEIAFAMNVAAPIAIVETGSTTADANGNVSFEVTNRGAGDYRITMTDGVTTKVASATIGNASGNRSAQSGAGALPRTGDDSSVGLAQIGFAAVAIGSVAIYGAKRRKTKAFA